MPCDSWPARSDATITEAVNAASSGRVPIACSTASANRWSSSAVQRITAGGYLADLPTQVVNG